MFIHKKYSASMTIYMTFTLILTISFLFSLLEAARISEIQNQTEQNSIINFYSLLGQYNVFLWENYHLLYLDGSWETTEFQISNTESRMLKDANDNLALKNYGSNENYLDFYQYHLQSIKVMEYLVSTDFDGNALREQISSFMGKEAAIDSLTQVNKKLIEFQALKEEETKNEKRKIDSQNALAEAEKIEREEKPEIEEKKYFNSIEYAETLKRSSLLNFVHPNPNEISLKFTDTGNVIEKRKLIKGNWSKKLSNKVGDPILFQSYLEKYFTNATETKAKGPKEHVLDYELEYIISGKESDKKNLESVVNKLLLIREAGNIITLMKDTGKRTAAQSIALVTVGFTGIPVLIQAVEIGVLLAWAYIESILDVKSLLNGNKIPLIKNTSEWQVDISNPKKSIETSTNEKSNKRGLNYVQYLHMLLFTSNQRSLNYRCMDIMEFNSSIISSGKKIRLDYFIQSLDMSFAYQGEELFWNLIIINKGNLSPYHFKIRQKVSYVN